MLSPYADNRLVLKLITDNHDLQYRHRWETDDVVIWDKYAVSCTLDVILHHSANRL